MTTVQFEIPCDPIAKGRPRFGNGRTYTPPETAAYESRVALYGRQAMAAQALRPMGGALFMQLEMLMPIPRSFTKAQRLAVVAGQLLPTGRPDADNLAKAVLDGLEGICYVNDAQVVNLNVKKAYSAIPKVLVWISES